MAGMSVLCLDTIWRQYEGEIHEDVQLVRRASAELQADRLGVTLCEDARRAAHMLAGSVGTFGFREASEAARALELELAEGCPSGPAAIAELFVALESGLDLTARAGSESRNA
jgi:HPt (histidine-containing phosphotransfer) domain-containing protein